MKARDDCCRGVGRRMFARRGGLAGWVVPASALALMPKCPACVAAYVAAATGVAVSASTAWYLRGGAMVLCGAMLAYLVVRTCRQRYVRKET